jgi:DNA-binding MarR family transcriptional regulator
MDAWRAFLRAYDHAMRALDRDLREAHDLTIGDFDVLVQLSLAPARRLRMRDLARATLFSPSGITRACERLESLGLVARERSGDDARGTDAVLTETGRTRLRSASRTHRAGISEVFARHVGNGDLEPFAAVLARIADGDRRRA